MGMLEYLITVFVERAPWERWLFQEPDPTLHLQKLLEKQAATQVANPKPLLLTQDTAVSTAQEIQEANSLEYQYDLLLDDLQHLETEHLPTQGRIGGLPCDCLIPGTLVYTPNSIRPIEDFRRNHSAFTHEGRYKKVIAPMCRSYEGELISVTPYYINFPLMVTPNHPVLAVKDGALPLKSRQRFTIGQMTERELTWVPAGDLGLCDLIAFPRLLYSRDAEIVNLDMAELFGWYVAEGCKDQKSNRIVFALGKHEREKIEHIEEIIQRQFGIEPRVYERPTSIHITFCHKDFSHLFESFGNGAREKRLPAWLLHLPASKQYAFLKGFIGGDGSVDLHSINLATSSRVLAAQLRLLLFRLGLLHNLSERENPDSLIKSRLVKARGPLYHIRIAGEAAVQLAKQADLSYRLPLAKPINYGSIIEGYALLPIRQIESPHYQGHVYNMEIAGDNTYVTLHGAIHNCIAKAGRDLRRHARETIPIAAREGLDASIFASMAAEGEQLIGIGTSDKVSSGQHDQDYLRHAGVASNLRKELEKMRRTTSPKANPGNPGPPGGKEPWQMTQDEFVAIYLQRHKESMSRAAYSSQTKPKLATVRAEAIDYQEHTIRQALKAGKPVPAEVLKDYPDLQSPTPEPALDCPRCEKIKRRGTALENPKIGHEKAEGGGAPTTSFLRP